VFDPRNRRLKLYGLTAKECREPAVAAWRDGLRTCPDLYTKLIVYGRPDAELAWVAAGFQFEGVIRGYFADGGDAQIWVAFGDEERSDAPRDAEHDRTVELAESKPIITPAAPAGLDCRRAAPDDAAAIVALMDETFDDYPTPIAAEVLAAQIEDGSNVFRCLTDDDGGLVASASAEIDHRRLSAELTDCATHPAHRGAGHMAYLLYRLEQDMERDLGITDLYTLARADEVGMNCVFGKLGFAWTGRLVGNCRMPNGWESMNIWCKNTDEGTDDGTEGESGHAGGRDAPA